MKRDWVLERVVGRVGRRMMMMWVQLMMAVVIEEVVCEIGQIRMVRWQQ